MSDRKKKALGWMIGGAVTLVVGIITWATPTTPTWVSTALAIVAAVAAVVGIGVTLPDL